MLVLGSGLTALDLLATLLRQGHRGPIDVLSPARPAPAPAGARPGAAARRPGAAHPRPDQRRNARVAARGRPAHRAGLDTRLAPSASAAAQAQGETWHAGFDELRNTVWRAWPLLPAAEQRRFLRQLRTWYDMHRFRTPPMTDARAWQAAVAAGQVRYRAARVQRVAAGPDGRPLATWVDRDGTQQQAFDAVLNCTGLDAAAQVDDNPLLASMREQGLLQVDAAGIGLAVDAQGRALGRDGQADPRLRVIGPPTAGSFR